MVFYIYDERREGYCQNDKERFLKDLSELIDELEKESATIGQVYGVVEISFNKRRTNND